MNRLLLALLLVLPTIILAQQTTNLKPKDETEIRFQARKQLTELGRRLNLLSDSTLLSSEIERIIKNSYLPHPSNQLFYNDDAIVEDDIDPRHKDHTNVKDSPVQTYLTDFNIYYSAYKAPKIVFSNVTTDDVVQGEYISINVYFSSIFGGRHRKKTMPYTATERVATFRAEKEKNKWRVLIVQISFVKPKIEPKLTIIASTKDTALYSPLSLFYQPDTKLKMWLRFGSKKLEVVEPPANNQPPAGTYNETQQREYQNEDWRIAITSKGDLKVTYIKNGSYYIYLKNIPSDTEKQTTTRQSTSALYPSPQKTNNGAGGLFAFIIVIVGIIGILNFN
jgi:ABC-type antimicrobial peptide transport system permease subunit